MTQESNSEHFMSPKGASTSRTKAIAYIGISIAVIAVCAWVTIPIGPVPITLQMFAIPLIICILPPSWSVAAICCYVLLGLIGVPVFSSMRGGIGVLLGPTGGYLIGYIPGTIFASLLLAFGTRKGDNSRVRTIAFQVLAGMVFTLMSYIVGWVQYANVASVGLEAAFAVTVAPFIIPDILKVAAAVACAQPVNAALKAK